MRTILVGVIMFMLFSACNKRLDDFLFNNSKIDAYLLDAYPGDKPFDLPAAYHVPQELIHVFSFPVQSEGETLTIYGIYVGDLNRIATDTVIYYLHGNKDHMDFYWNRQKLLAFTGGVHRYGVLSIDYPGYGMSEGKPTEANMYESVRGGLNWLKDKGLTSDRLVAYGYSLGSAPACEIAYSSIYPLKPAKLILENPFASSEVMVQSSTGLSLPGSFFTNASIANAEKIKSVQQPFLWMHGTADSFLAIDTHGEVVYKNYAGSYSEAHRIEGAEHDGEKGIPPVMGFANYLQTVAAFLLK
jgi:pimeloyl-ACP methyl ester carboxylesterase